jgi:hypothetical protein
MNKKIRKQTISAAKYSGASLSIGASVAVILIHFVPSLRDVSEAVVILVSFVVNIALARSGVLSDSE